MAATTWTAGDTVRYMSGDTLLVTAGLFFYSGFGMGRYYGLDGEVRDGTRSEAVAWAFREGVTFRFVDSFDGYKTVYLGD